MKSKILLIGLSLAWMAPAFAGLKIQPGSVTVSGISSGAFMAVQLEVAASSVISGVGSVAGGIYGCAEGNAATAMNLCMAFPSLINSSYFTQKARLSEAWGGIDPLSHLRTHRVYLFQSRADETVHAAAAEKLAEFYTSFLPRQGIRMEWHDSAAHGFPTQDQGGPCDEAGPPWLVKCGVDVAHHILRHLYGKLLPPESAPNGGNANLHRFSQGPYASPRASLLPEGYIYIPRACENGLKPCRLHLALHGCRQSPEFAGENFVRHAGYNRWAEANRIIVLYPAVAQSPANPKGCWDWWGYTGPDYALKSGAQIQALLGMIEGLSRSADPR